MFLTSMIQIRSSFLAHPVFIKRINGIDSVQPDELPEICFTNNYWLGLVD